MPRERLREGGKCGSCHRPLFEKHPAALNSAARFDKHAQRSDIPLLVDFGQAGAVRAGRWRRSSNTRQPSSSLTCG
ncbi:MAG: hypothetical protein ACXU89_16550 [Xanthobacteraceae bacterium]